MGSSSFTNTPPVTMVTLTPGRALRIAFDAVKTRFANTHSKVEPGITSKTALAERSRIPSAGWLSQRQNRDSSHDHQPKLGARKDQGSGFRISALSVHRGTHFDPASAICVDAITAMKLRPKVRSAARSEERR